MAERNELIKNRFSSVRLTTLLGGMNLGGGGTTGDSCWTDALAAAVTIGKGSALFASIYVNSTELVTVFVVWLDDEKVLRYVE